MKNYRVTAEREGPWWLITVADPHLVTQARRLDQVEAMARDLIALWLEVPEDSFSIDVTVELDDVTRRSVEEVKALQTAAARASFAASAALRDFAARLLAQGYTVRDAGAILDVSPQRISQLTAEPAKKTAPVKRALKSVPAPERSTAGGFEKERPTGHRVAAAAAKVVPRPTPGRKVAASPATHTKTVMTNFKNNPKKG